MATRKVPAYWTLTDYTQGEEDTLAATLTGLSDGSKVIYNTTLDIIRVWTGSSFSSVPPVPGCVLPWAAPLASPAFTGNPTGLTKTHVGLGNLDNTSDTSKPVSTAQSTVLNTATSSYRTILQAGGSHIAARVAGTYGMGQGDPLAISGTGTLYPLAVIHIVGADYPTINGVAPKLRIRAQLFTNDVAPTGNFTFGLYPITRPSTSGGTGLCIYTIGTVVSGSNGATFTTPAADLLGNAVGADFALPSDGPYVIAVVTTATVATNAHVHLSAQLQLRNA